MKLDRNIFAVTIALALLAGGMRFFRLGTYPFAGDETATLAETRSFLGEYEETQDEQIRRLPRMIPLTYVVHALGYTIFGRDEFGSRVLMAILGTAGCVLFFLGLVGPLGRLTAFVAALLIAVWPEQLLQSQQNRFYITAWFFSALCMLLGGLAVQRRSTFLTASACLAGMAAVLTHTLLVILLPGLFLACIVAAWMERGPWPWRMLAVVTIAGLATGAFLVLYLLPLGQGWNSGAVWGYSPIRSVLGSVNQVGWPVVLLAGLGTCLVCRQRNVQGSYWLVWLLLWAVASVALPRLVVYHPEYAFPLASAAIVLAAIAASDVAERLRPAGIGLAWLWIGLVAALQLPSVVSHYSDGSRNDHRTAARYIAERWQPEDRLAAYSPGLLQHYENEKLPNPAILLARDPQVARATLEDAVKTPGRLWIVISFGRSGKEEMVEQWLRDNHCEQELIVKKPRFDYYEFAVEVYLHK